MADYRAYFVGDDGHIIGFEPPAVERAKRLVTKHSVELWSGDRLVQRLNATDRPSGDAVTHQIKDGRMVPKK